MTFSKKYLYMITTSNPALANGVSGDIACPSSQNYFCVYICHLSAYFAQSSMSVQKFQNLPKIINCSLLNFCLSVFFEQKT